MDDVFTYRGWKCRVYLEGSYFFAVAEKAKEPSIHCGGYYGKGAKVDAIAGIMRRVDCELGRKQMESMGG